MEPLPKRTRGRKRKAAVEDVPDLFAPSTKKSRVPEAGSSGSVAQDTVAGGSTATPSSNRAAARGQETAEIATQRELRTPTKARMVSQSTASPSRTTPRRVLRRAAPGPTEYAIADIYPMYRDLVRDRSVLFVQLETRSWAAQLYDFDLDERHRGVHGWTVVSAAPRLDGTCTYSCLPCRDFKEHSDCVHVRLVQDRNAPRWVILSDDYGDDVIPLEGCGEKDTQWSWACLSQNQLPVFVGHAGRSFSSGTWACSIHRGDACCHVARVKEWAREVEEKQGAECPYDDDDEGADADTVEDMLPAENSTEETLLSKTLLAERSVSALPVGPPRWSRLPTDTVPSWSLVDPVPEVLPLAGAGRCNCGSVPEESVPLREIPCVIYSSRRAYHRRVQVRPCPKCPSDKKFAGPDLREFGIFNFNNRSMYTHELLNSFTSAMTAHELPFHAFATTVDRNYKENALEDNFVSDETFCLVWYSFHRVQLLGDSFVCPDCGPNPRVVICDGLSAGFCAKHITETLAPPTKLEPGAPVRNTVHSPVESTAAVTGKLRERAQKAVRWRLQLTKSNTSRPSGITTGAADGDGQAVPDADVDVEGAERETATRLFKRDVGDRAMRETLESIGDDLDQVDGALAAMFKHFVTPNYGRAESLRKQYLELLDQVFGYENVLLMAPEPTWMALTSLEKNEPNAGPVLTGQIPGLGRVAEYEWKTTGSYSDNLRGLAAFLRGRAIRVSCSLSQHEFEPADSVVATGNWEETGCYYGRPQVRVRPEYPHLPGDKKIDRSTVTESGAGGIGCSKFYEAYGQKGLTGGLMAFWCPHLVCLGFHCIPVGEGRNDVFSALFTRWEKPPETVIYDFACALAQYCLLREPKYFKNTRFLIDGFHAKGHTRCTRCCFISTFKKDPTLSSVNSSAAECGNRGLLKIRRPLRYMTQRRAIIYVYKYLATWNRDRRINGSAKKRVLVY